MSVIVFDHTRFAGNVYAVVDGITVARIVTVQDGFIVLQCPDAPPRYGISTEKLFVMLGDAQQYITSYVGKHPLKF